MSDKNPIVATALKVTYSSKWKCGEQPDKKELGKLNLGEWESVESVMQQIRKCFPCATNFRIELESGEPVCAGHLD